MPFGTDFSRLRMFSGSVAANLQLLVSSDLIALNVLRSWSGDTATMWHSSDALKNNIRAGSLTKKKSCLQNY